MKELISIARLPLDRVTTELIDDLVAIYPEGERIGGSPDKRTRSFCFIDIPREDPRVEKVLNTLKMHGWYPKVDQALPYQPNEFWLTFKRKYSPRDYEKSEYLQISARGGANSFFRHRKTGFLKVSAAHLRRTRANVLAPALLVRDCVRKLLESSDLRHLVFRPILPVENANYENDEGDVVVSWDRIGDKWWELTSDFVLPPLNLGKIEFLDSVTFLPITDPTKQTPVLREGLYFEPELHFRRADMEALEPFDLALTREFNGRVGDGSNEPWRVASQELYQFFKKHKITAGWQPVRLDD